MSFVVRKVGNKRKFDKLLKEESFIVGEEIQADAVTDLKTTRNSLSIYLAPNKNSIKRVVVAIAATRDNIQQFDYVVLGSEDFEELVVRFEFRFGNQGGNTPNDEVNEWHKNVIELTDRRIVELARSFIYHAKKKRMLSKEVESLIKNGIDKKTLDEDRINKKIMFKLKEKENN